MKNDIKTRYKKNKRDATELKKFIRKSLKEKNKKEYK